VKLWYERPIGFQRNGRVELQIMAQKWRVFTNDVGPHQYSGLKDITASSLSEAKAMAKQRWGNLPIDPRRVDKTLRILVLPHSEKNLWPNGQTGRIPKEAECCIVGHM
jgi:hypothetical protein